MTDTHNPSDLPTMPPNGADISISVRQVFGIDVDMEVPGFSQVSEHVPEVDQAYHFDPETTLAILAGFSHNRRVMIQGYHGTGKSTHIEQVAARLNWPCIRVNLDSHISRIDLIGKDAIVVKDGMQVTEFREGLLPWAGIDPHIIHNISDEDRVQLGEAWENRKKRIIPELKENLY